MQYPQTKITPWDHQVDGFNLTDNHFGFYYAWDMGAGKTKGGIDYSNSINAKKVLITCPNKVISVWPGQFRIHSYQDYNVMPVTKKLGTSEKKARAIYEHIKKCEQIGQPCAIVINYESCWRQPIGPIYNDSGKMTNLGMLMSQDWDLIIADEAHRMKTPGGKASWMMKRLNKKGAMRLWLSGTPMPHSPLDLYAQFRALDPSIFGTNFTFFKRRYCQLGGFEGRQVVGWINQNELQEKFYSIAHHVHADDCLDLPGKQDIFITCDLDSKAKKIYQELNRDFIADVNDGVIVATNALVKMLRLAQIAGGYLQYEHEIDADTTVTKNQIIDNSKIETLIELMKGLPPQEPVVIFVRFRNEIDRIIEAINKSFTGLDKRNITEFSGRTDEPLDFVDSVWRNTFTDTAIVQIQAGCEGIDMTAARYTFYFSIGFSLGQYRQSRRRTRRPGQTRKCFYYHIIATGTVDRKIMTAIKEKKRIVNSVLNQTKMDLGKNASMIEDAPNFLLKN